MFGFAGLYDVWKDRKTGKEIESYTIITTEPNAEAVTEFFFRYLPHEMLLDGLRQLHACDQPGARTDRAAGHREQGSRSQARRRWHREAKGIIHLRLPDGRCHSGRHTTAVFPVSLLLTPTTMPRELMP